MLSIRALSVARSSACGMWRRALTTRVAGTRDAGSAHEPAAQHQSYLKGLLSEDDAGAPWHQAPIEMVSREVQAPKPSAHESCGGKGGSQFMDLPQLERRTVPVIGVCAMDSKARSKPMASVLEQLQATGRYEVAFFGEKTILDEPVEAWPVCDFLIAFFSNGFPLAKATSYARLRKPFSVNSLERQFLLMDRRVVLATLAHAGVPIPFHVVASRDGGAQVHPLARHVVPPQVAAALEAGAHADVTEVDEDTLRVGHQVIRKPFVEKPCDAEDHNIYIYYSRAQGGGVRRLFRKIGNRSSEFVSGPAHVRTHGSFVYEEFVAVDDAVDVKVYTVGHEYAHAETRKSPVVDGHVRRNIEGKEMRFSTELTADEHEYARRVSQAFGQRVCGFDILRAAGRSMVMDVNGWSFVKGNDVYYDQATRILDARFQEALRHRWFARFVDPDAVGRATYESRWVLKAVLDVCRHADRTPKQKMKCVLHSAPVVALLDAGAEAVMRAAPDLHRVLAALDHANSSPHPDDSAATIGHLRDVLQRKIAQPGTKVQVKPLDGAALLVLKWGGECTHAGLVQAQDLGRRMRTDLLLINRSLLDDVRFYSSAECRVQSTVAAYADAFLGEMPAVAVRSDMLDDNSTDAKLGMDAAKQRMRDLFNYPGPVDSNPHCGPALRLPPEIGHPREFLHGICDLISRLVARMDRNFEAMGAATLDRLQPDWCCNENADLFRERWKKILSDFRTVDAAGSKLYDPAKVGELYDSLKYDALHNRRFLERIFMPTDELLSLPPVDHSPPSGPAYPPDPLLVQQDVRALYYRAKLLFDYVTRREYGIGPEQRRRIGIQAS
ncbi:inositol hexakisphosphate and diphosphoinositol-pentakisphosphate kinase, partial [Coemansia biformis]